MKASWDVVSLESDSIEINFSFDNPLQVSQGEDPDIMFI